MRRTVICHRQTLLQFSPSPLTLCLRRRCSAMPAKGSAADTVQAPLQPRVLSIQSHVVHGYVGKIHLSQYGSLKRPLAGKHNP